MFVCSNRTPALIALCSGLNDWVAYFRKHRVNVYIEKAEAALDEFVILKPQELSAEKYNGLLVDRLDAVARYCDKHIDTFEYSLAYLKAKFKVRTKASIDKGVLEEAVKAA